LRIEVFRNGDLTDQLLQMPRVTSNGGAYQVLLLANRLHFLRAFVDVNDNDALDDGEPFTIYDGRDAPFGDPLPQGVADLDISFGAEATPTATPDPGAVLSGSIEYTGSGGPVSESNLLILILSTSPLLQGNPVGVAFVDTNGGSFEIQAPAPGDYYLAYLLDSNGDQFPSLGDSFEVYEDREFPPGDVVSVPQSGLALTLDDSFGLPGVEGTVTYTGSQGPVSEDSPILVDAYRQPDLSDRLEQTNVVDENGGSFRFILFESRAHYLTAYLDRNRNSVRDPGEPFTIFDGRGAPPADSIPQDGSSIDVTFGDENAEDPTPTATVTPRENVTPLETPPTPTETATASPSGTAGASETPTPDGPACVGDCDGDGEVAINELVTAVNIALGVFDVSQCPSADADGNGTVSINELVQAVNNALDGCPAWAGGKKPVRGADSLEESIL